MNPKIRRNQDSMKTYESNKHLKTFQKPDTLKNFYFDNFNTAKENQTDMSKINKSRRYLFKPKDNVIIPPEPQQSTPDIFNHTFNKGFNKPLPKNTYDRIFNTARKQREFYIEQEKKKGAIRRNNKAYRDAIGNMFEEQGKISKTQIISEKPCNDNYKLLSSEAKRNLTERYYYDNSANQW